MPGNQYRRMDEESEGTIPQKGYPGAPSSNAVMNPYAGYPQPGSQPYGSPGTQPYGASPPGTKPDGGYPPPGWSHQAGGPPPAMFAYGNPAEFQQYNPNGGNNVNPVPPVAMAPADLGEDGVVKGFDFSEKSIRRGFIRKVYAILMSQLLVTFGVLCLFTYHRPTQMFMLDNIVILYASMAVGFVCILIMICFDEMRRKAPANFIFLGIFTAAQSITLGSVGIYVDSDTVMMAVGVTAVLCLALTLFAFQTRFDFTIMGGMLYISLIVLILFGLLTWILGTTRILDIVYSSIGALLFSLYIIYDTQMMMGGNHKYSVSPEEYVFAALNLYLDVLNLFLYILRIMASR